MNQAQAIAKLRKALGASFAYRTDPKALTGEDLEAAKVELGKATAAKKAAEDAVAARLQELQKDPEYVRLVAERKAAQEARDKAWSRSYARRVTVGTASSLAFHVKAEGDNWDEVVRKVIDKPT